MTHCSQDKEWTTEAFGPKIGKKCSFVAYFFSDFIDEARSIKGSMEFSDVANLVSV